MSLWMAVTRLGDVMVMAPVAAIILAGFLMARSWRLAAWWCFLFGGTMAIVIATKIAFVGWGVGIRPLYFTGISGHAVRALAVLPVLACLVSQKSSFMVRTMALLLAVVLALVISISRMVLHMHSASETASGCLLGTIVSISFIFMLGDAWQFDLKRPLLLLSLSALLLAPFLKPAPTEHLIAHLARYLGGVKEMRTEHAWKYFPSDKVNRIESERFD